MKRYVGDQKPRRHWHQLVAEILRAAKPGGTRTSIANDTRLNWDQVANRYIPELLRLDLLRQQGKRYFTTFRGDLFIERFDDLLRVIDGPPMTGWIEVDKEMEI